MPKKESNVPENKPLSQSASVDDLVWKLGQDVVEQLGAKRLITDLQAGIKKEEGLQEKVTQLERSNAGFDKNNKDLAKVLEEEREKSRALQTELDRRDKVSRRNKKKKKK